MNILPKKRWHVRTKENIARVRKDEAEAAEKEKQEKLRIEVADREARLKILKKKSKQMLLELDIKFDETDLSETIPDHINLFADLEHSVTTKNKDHELEEKEKKEEYEKKIGYLTYLGQGTNEEIKKKNWYEVLPQSSRYSRSSDIKDTYDKLILKDSDGKPKQQEIDVKNGEVCWKQKQKLDPINSFKNLCSQQSKPDKNINVINVSDLSHCKDNKILKYGNNERNKKAEEKNSKLQKLREARIKREQQEKYKTDIFLKKLTGTDSKSEKQEKPHSITPKYNSQFNPQLARQNYM